MDSAAVNVVHDSLASGTIEDAAATLLAMLADGESVAAQYAGPVRRSPHDMLMALTEHHAIAILCAYDISLPIKRIPPRDHRLRIPRTALAMSSARPLTTHVMEDGAVLTGGASVFIDGFGVGMLEIPAARLSASQHQALRGLVAALGEPLKPLEAKEAEHRHERRVPCPPSQERAVLALVMLIAGPVILLSGACGAAWRKLCAWLGASSQ